MNCISFIIIHSKCFWNELSSFKGQESPSDPNFDIILYYDFSNNSFRFDVCFKVTHFSRSIFFACDPPPLWLTYFQHVHFSLLIFTHDSSASFIFPQIVCPVIHFQHVIILTTHLLLQGLFLTCDSFFNVNFLLVIFFPPFIDFLLIYSSGWCISLCPFLDKFIHCFLK